MYELFTTLLLKILPLYLLIILGFISEKYLKLGRNAFAKLLLYILTPLVLFFAALKAELNQSNLLLPFFLFLTSSLITFIYYYVAKLLKYQQRDCALMAYAAGASNTGYFGLPVVSAIFGEQAFLIAAIANMGGIIYEATVGIYFAASGKSSIKESLLKLLYLPHLYALALGFLLNQTTLADSKIIDKTFQSIASTYTVLGMMIIGIALVNIKINLHKIKFCSLITIAKFLILPILCLSLILIDSNYTKIYNYQVYNIVLVLCATPLAAGSVVIATEFDLDAENAAISVLLTTLLALAILPLFASFLF